MHSPTQVGGLAGVFLLLRYVVPLLAFAVIFDVARRPASDFPAGGHRGRKWFWILPQALVLAVQVVGMAVPAARAGLGLPILVLVPLVLVQQVAYVLVVVVPLRAEKRRERDEAENHPKQPPA
jgi:hypothetical protein